MIKKMINFFVKLFPEKSQLLAFKILYKDQLNVNLDLCNPNQKRVLISYITLTGFDFANVKHASFYHLNQILRYFISKDYCIDLCRLDDMGAYQRLKKTKYDVIFGFGPVYKEFCKNHDIPLRICFVMENNPMVVKEKYDERLKYFKCRHNKLDSSRSLARIGYFDRETFELSNNLVLMNSVYNSLSFKDFFSSLELINCNALFNEHYEFDKDIILTKIDKSRNNVLWFGSKGIIHKGLDILIDAVAQMPEKRLCCYGIDKGEIQFFNKLKSHNSINCGSINVLGNEFINEVIYNHNICVFPSCSEGMSTAVATCMAHGIIPIITRETGFNKMPFIIELESFTVEQVRKSIEQIQSLSVEELLQMRYDCYVYSRTEFSLNTFNRQFSSIMDRILSL